MCGVCKVYFAFIKYLNSMRPDRTVFCSSHKCVLRFDYIYTNMFNCVYGYAIVNMYFSVFRYLAYPLTLYHIPSPPSQEFSLLKCVGFKQSHNDVCMFRDDSQVLEIANPAIGSAIRIARAHR